MEDVDIDGMYQRFWKEFAKKISQRPESPLYYDSEEEEGHYLSQKRNLPSGINYSLVSNTNRGHLQAKLHIKEKRDDRDEIFTHLRKHRQGIESEIGEELEWTRNQEFDTIIVQRDWNIRDNPERWDHYLEWLIEYGETFDEVFDSYLEEYY